MDPVNGYSIFIAILSVLGLAFNLSLIITIVTKVQQRTSFHYILLSLSCADILATVGSTSFGMLTFFKHDHKSLSIVSLFFVYYSNLVSFLHIILIAILRAFATIYPFQFKTNCSGCRLFTAISIAWLLCAVFIVLVAFQVFHFLVIGYVGVLTCAILVFVYFVICLYLRQQQRSIAGSSRLRKSTRSSVIVLRHSIAVTATFILCFVPSAIFAMLKFPGGFVSFAIVTCLLVLNPLIDPLLYFFVSHFKIARLERSQNATPVEVNTPGNEAMESRVRQSKL